MNQVVIDRINEIKLRNEAIDYHICPECAAPLTLLNVSSLSIEHKLINRVDIEYFAELRRTNPHNHRVLWECSKDIAHYQTIK